MANRAATLDTAAPLVPERATLPGSGFRVTEKRGDILSTDFAERVMATVHPSAVLRIPEDEDRRRERARFVADLKKAAALL